MALFKCEYCPMNYNSKKSLFQHISDQHIKKRWQCGFECCKATFNHQNRNKDLPKHQHKVHENGSDDNQVPMRFRAKLPQAAELDYAVTVSVHGYYGRDDDLPQRRELYGSQADQMDPGKQVLIDCPLVGGCIYVP